MKEQQGTLVISLDFELLWGVRDKRTIASYGKDILAVKEVIPRLLEIFSKYGIKVTFSTVGFLFAHTKEELLSYVPDRKPGYHNKNLSPYNGHFDQVGDNFENDPYHFAPDLISLIKKDNNQTIGTHTFSHYYCQEAGQTLEEFKKDLEAAIKISEDNGIKVDSIVFPRNQCNQAYLEICKQLGITSYRGNERNWAFQGNGRHFSTLAVYARRFFRGLDAYFNVFGHHCYTWEELGKKDPIYNIPSSRLLRPFSKKLGFLEFLKIRRIKKSLKYAAKTKKVYHLWWHPHNFGANLEQNFKNLDRILSYCQTLEKKYGFDSDSMETLVKKLQKNG